MIIMSKKILIICNIALLLAVAAFATLFFTTRTNEVPSDEPPEWKVLFMKNYTQEQIKEMEMDLALRASLWQGHGVPDQDDISMAEALERSKQALIQQKGFSEEEIATYFLLPYYLTSQGSFVTTDGKRVPLPAPYWQMNYEGGPLKLYSVFLDAKTGEILTITSPEDGNG